MNRTVGMILLCAGTLLAQDGVEKATVPLHDPTRPPQVHAHLMAGGITVRGADVKDVMVEAHPRDGGARHEPNPPRADGMKRLDLPGAAGLDVVEENNVVSIGTESRNNPVDLVITVPRRASLQLKCLNDGDIHVDQVDGEIDADDLNGGITLRNVSGSVVAHSLNGAVLVTFDRIDPAKPMSFSTLNGDIDVTFPETLKANVRMKTDNGAVYSDFEVKLNSETNLVRGDTGRQPDGTYHLRFDHALRGAINGGGPEYQFTSFNGQIYIRKKK
ncbi:MAG: DUF4097 family beta strand repeat protein [Acidobacteriaceae bacterium]|nr:DUF4097 family beta strand repeat protein [Acidobacteriaceae bacterium]